jgi:hypothetical protein
VAIPAVGPTLIASRDRPSLEQKCLPLRLCCRAYAARALLVCLCCLASAHDGVCCE